MRRAHWIYLSATMCAWLIDRWFFKQKLNVRCLPEAHKTGHSAIHLSCRHLPGNTASLKADAKRDHALSLAGKR